MSVKDDTQARLAHAVAEEASVAKPAHGVLLTDVAAVKVKSLLEQEGRDDLRLRVGCSRVAVPAWSTSCTSTSAPSTVT